jgi:hypothetical protein
VSDSHDKDATLPDRGGSSNQISDAPTRRARFEPEATNRSRRPTDQGRRYIFGAEIARGGMGRVVEATDTVLGRTVAIKEVLELDEGLVQRFERETQITARLEHPSIIPVHDAGRSANGAPFYVMRKVTGQPLVQLVRAAESLSDRLALLPHVLAAANAIAHAHGRGVIHRDLKPTNILVGKLGETVVIDWGLAKVIDEADATRDSVKLTDDADSLQTRVGDVIGTPGFMSPEQLKGKSVDARADVYALGATLYFLLARRVPHAAKTGDEMIQAALAGPPTPLRALAPGVPPELATIVDRALATELDVRYRDAGGLAADLDRFLKGQLVASHRYSRRERLSRWLRRNRVAVAVAAVAAVAIAVGGSIAIARTIRERDRADRALVVARSRNEQLQLSHALALVKSHPTGAIALARPLAATHWKTMRALAMAARSRGVAYGMPASQFTRSLEMAADGIRVLSAGNDGIIRIHDLRARSSRVIARLGSDTFAAWADGEAQIVAWTRNKIVVIPTAGGAEREVVLESEPARLSTGGGTQLAWCDRDGAVWTMSLATLEPRRVDIGGDRVDHLSAHGTTFALAGEQSTFLLGPTGVRTVIKGHARELAFSPTGKLAAIIDDYRGPLAIVELDPRGDLVSRTELPDALAIVWQHDLLWVGAQRGLGTRVAIEVQVRGGVHELIDGPGGSLIARTRNSAFTLFDHKIIAEIPPTYAIHDLATGSNSGFVAAGSDYVVLVWTLEDVQPQTLPLQAPTRTAFAGADQMIAIHDATHGTWIELESLQRRPIELPGELDAIAFAPDGSSAVALTNASTAVLYRRGAPGSTLLGTGITAAAFATPTHIVVGTEQGVVRTIDLAGDTVRELFTGASRVEAIKVRGDWLAAQFKDGQLARMRVDGSSSAALAADHKLHWFEQFASGELAYTDFTQLRVWQVDGSSTPYPGLPTPVSAVEAIGPDSFVVYTGGDSAHLIELRPVQRVLAAYPPGMRMEWLRFEGDHGVYLSPDGSLFATSPRSGISWQIATARRERFMAPTLSRDRDRVFAITGDRLLVWKHAQPKDAVETAALLDSLTNARPALTGDSVDAPTPTLQLRWD